KPITSPSESASEEDNDPEQAQRDKDMQKNLALIVKNQRTMNVAGARENVGSSVVQQSGIQCFNCKEFGHFAKECRKPKRVKDSAYHKEKMLMCKQAEKETSKTLGESNSVRDSCLVALQNKQTEFEKYKAFNDRTVDYDKLEHKLNETLGLLAHFKEIFDNAWVKHTKDQFHAPTAQDMDILITTCLMTLALKTQNDSFIFVHELKQEMYADLKYVESIENEIDELKSDKAEFSNMYDMILQECVSNKVMCTYLLSLSDLDALAELQCLYLHKVKECDCLTQKLSKQTKSVSKEVHTELLRCFAKIVQLILFIVDSRCTKHMTGNLKLLCSFVEKYLGTVHFGNDQLAPILGYGDLVQGYITINRVYYIEGLNRNLLSVGQFCDVDLEVSFRKCTCLVRDLQGNDLLTGNRGYDLYTISLQESTSTTPLCLMAKASPTQAWLWHRRLSHLNFDYINLLSKKDVVIGLLDRFIILPNQTHENKERK
nr:retrovirus-related Pol polyprotein from transposon TNT 1-94 [Tanacetum cinerariifolium]